MDHQTLLRHTESHRILLARRSGIWQLESTKRTCGTHTFYCYPITGYDSPIIIITVFKRYTLYYVNKMLWQNTLELPFRHRIYLFVPKCTCMRVWTSMRIWTSVCRWNVDHPCETANNNNETVTNTIELNGEQKYEGKIKMQIWCVKRVYVIGLQSNRSFTADKKCTPNKCANDTIMANVHHIWDGK